MWKKKKIKPIKWIKPSIGATDQTDLPTADQSIKSIKLINRSNLANATDQTQQLIKRIYPLPINPSNPPLINPSTTRSSRASDWVVFLGFSPTSDRCRSFSWISLVGIDLSSQRHSRSGRWEARKSIPYGTARYIPYRPVNWYRYPTYFVPKKIPTVLAAYRPYQRNPTISVGKCIPDRNKKKKKKKKKKMFTLSHLSIHRRHL